MKILWVNHASFVLEAGNVRLICDPWIEGTAFNNGWRLLSPTKFAYEDFANITHIWFSHEHPDHFALPNLRKIPEEIRRRITVLFHFTKDKRVLNVCKSLGFSTQELPESQWVRVGDLDLICGRNEEIDSWLGIRTGHLTLLNLNDCVFSGNSELRRIYKLVGSPDVLFTQFSYASWVGNRGDTASHRRSAQSKRNEMRKQTQIFQPKWIVPFASFVWFSHQDNYYMNECANGIRDIFSFCADELETRPIVLYPGDTWEIGAPHDSAAALRAYEADYKSMSLTQTRNTSAPVSDHKLREAAALFVSKIQKRNNRLLLRLIPATTAYLTDKDQTATISFSGMTLTEGRTGRPDIYLDSDSLAYCMRYGWGGDTLHVNGRYQTPAGGNPRRFFRIFRIFSLNTAEEYLDIGFVCGKIIQRAMQWIPRWTTAQEQ